MRSVRADLDGLRAAGEDEDEDEEGEGSHWG